MESVESKPIKLSRENGVGYFVDKTQMQQAKHLKE